MKLADKVSIILLALIVAMLIGLLSPIDAKEPVQILEARCTSKDFTRLYCKLRTSDDRVYINGKWVDRYVISDTIYVDNELNLLLLEKDK